MFNEGDVALVRGYRTGQPDFMRRKVLKVLAEEPPLYVIVDDRHVVQLAEARALQPAPYEAEDRVAAITPEVVADKIDRVLALHAKRQKR
jgi:hypothetical protein